MKKQLFLTALFLTLSLNAHAQSGDLVSDITGVSDEKLQEITKEKSQENIADDRGVFSFLNFSFIKKPLSLLSSDSKEQEESSEITPETPQEQEKIKETPLERATRLAEQGDIEKELTLGYMYLYGQNGVEKDYQKAFHFYELAAAQNDVIALNNLGSLYFNGIGTDVNYEKASELFLKAAQNGSDDAAVNLAFIYLTSGRSENFESAVELFEQAAKAGNNTAKFMLGYAYYRGFVVEQDFHKAVRLIKEAADANFDEAHYIFAKIYANGEGITKNYGNAVKHYRAAIAQGHISSMMELATILKEGKMFPQNLIQAHILYNIASVYGDSIAGEYRDSLEKVLKLEDLLEAQNVAEQYRPNPSELTKYIRQTFGENICQYIDQNLTRKGKQN